MIITKGSSLTLRIKSFIMLVLVTSNYNGETNMTSKYAKIYNSLDFFNNVFNVLKSTGPYSHAEQTEERIIFRGSAADVDMKRIILAKGFELFLNRCHIRETVVIPAELHYDALDIRLFFENNDNSTPDGGVFYGFTFFKDKNDNESRFIATYPKMNRYYMSLFIDSSYLSQYIDISAFKNIEIDQWCEMNIAENKAIFSILQDVRSNDWEKSIQRMFFQAKSMELMSIIVDALKRHCQVHSSPEVVVDISDREAIVKAREIVRNRFCESLTIEDISKQVYKNSHWIKTKYKAVFGTTIRQDIISHRMNKALELLRSNHYSVEATARQIGYEHIGHFIATFKKHFGCTPGEFCSRLKQN